MKKNIKFTKKTIAGLFILLCLCWGMSKSFHQFYKSGKSSEIVQKVAPFAYKNIKPDNYQPLGPFTKAERKILFNIIHQTIADGLANKEKTYPDLSQFPESWRTKQAVYVTLNIGDKLRGCKGTQTLKKPFIHALVDATYRAAFKDSRFPKLTQNEFKNPEFNTYFTILGPFKKMQFKTEKDLLKQMTPLKFQYGMRMRYKNSQGIFLSIVWKTRPTNEDFLQALKKKSGLPTDFFSSDMIIEYFPCEVVYDLNDILKKNSQRIETAFSAFKKLFRKDGSIQYKIDFKTGNESDSNNMVREMLSGYGLAYIFSQTHDKELKPILVKFLKYAESVSTPYKNGFLITAKDGEIKSGATALALLTELYYQKESHDTQFAKSREKWKNALIALFKEGEGFYWAPTLLKTNQYYDGEIWLALSIYYDLFPKDLIVSELLPKVNKTLINKYGSSFHAGFFHWGLQAASYQYSKNKNSKLLNYIQNQIDFYLQTSIVSNAGACGWTEGLIEAANGVKEADKELYKKIVNRIEDELVVSYMLQDKLIQKIKNKKVKQGTEKFEGLFLYKPDSLVTRNDWTQHCMSALLRAQSLFQEFE